MFQGLQQKWKVTGLQLVLILCTFAIGGSLTGFVGRRMMNFVSIEQDWLWIVVYILIITLLWPAAVLFVSVFFGQYRFFIGYLRKIGKRMGVVKKMGNAQIATNNTLMESSNPIPPHFPGAAGTQPTRIAIFASGAGSNAQKIIDHFRHSAHIAISLIVCNKPGAGVLSIASKETIP